jgi:anti-sigma B factor antagonist
VLVDLSAVDYIDSSGIASLVEAFQKAKKAGTGFALASPNPAALRVLELARLDRVFRIFATLEEALDAGG